MISNLNAYWSANTLKKRERERPSNMIHNTQIFFPENSYHIFSSLGFPGSSVGKESSCNSGGPDLDPWVGKIP